MQLKNSDEAYGWLSIFFHWSVAFTVIGLFALGWWMDTLGYYSPYYQTAPALHMSIGVVMTAVLILRLLWRFKSPPPKAISSQAKWEIVVAHLVHWAFYGLILFMFVSGYLFTTSEGQGLSVFDIFEIPPVVDIGDELADALIEFHEWVAYTIIGLASLHGLAALKHHFIDKDVTLKRMLGIKSR